MNRNELKWIEIKLNVAIFLNIENSLKKTKNIGEIEEFQKYLRRIRVVIYHQQFQHQIFNTKPLSEKVC